MQFRSSSAGRRALAGLFAVSLAAGTIGATAPLAAAQGSVELPALPQIPGLPAAGDAPAESNPFLFDKTCAALPSGLYQSAYSTRQNALFVTRAVGRPPVKESTLFKLDADTLATKAEVTPAAEGEGEDAGLNAVYGVTVDDGTNTVWVTNTRQDSVAAYDATTLELKKQYPAGTVAHARDVVVDPSTGKAYVSSAKGGAGEIKVFDGTDLEKAPESVVIPDFGSTMSLDLDPQTGKLYTVSLDQQKAAEIDVRNGNTQRVFTLGADTGRASGAGLDTANQRLWVAHQESNNVEILDLATGKVVRTLPGAQPLNAKYDPVNELVYVTNREGLVRIYEANTLIEVGALAAGPDVATGATPNHVSIDGRGNAYTVNKFAPTEGDNTGKNQVCKITPKTMLLGSIGDIPHGQILGSLPDAPLPELPVGSLIPGK